jgi:hypothetical protein
MDFNPETPLEGAELVSKYPEKTVGKSEKLQKLILEKLERLPLEIEGHLHTTRVILPPKVALIIRERPSLVS